MKTQNAYKKIFIVAIITLFITSSMYFFMNYLTTYLWNFIPPGTIYRNGSHYGSIVGAFDAEYINSNTKIPLNYRAKYNLIDTIEINLIELFEKLSDNPDNFIWYPNSYLELIESDIEFGLLLPTTLQIFDDKMNRPSNKLPLYDDLLYPPFIEPYVYSGKSKGKGVVFSFIYPYLNNKVDYSDTDQYPREILHEFHSNNDDFWAPVVGFYATFSDPESIGEQYINEAYFSIIDHGKFLILPVDTEYQVHFWFNLPDRTYLPNKVTPEELIVTLNVYEII